MSPHTATSPGPAVSGFERFAATEGRRLQRVLSARFGIDVGVEVTADALAYAWEHWDTVEAMANPVGFLYRVAQSSARRHLRWRRPVLLPAEEQVEPGHAEPGLDAALATLAPDQRVAVLLVHGLGWSYQETASAMGVPVTTVRNHLHRGLGRLRQLLGEE